MDDNKVAAKAATTALTALGLAGLTACVCFGIFVGTTYGFCAGVAAGVGYLVVMRRINAGLA